MGAADRRQRWRRRAAWATVLRAVVFCAPVAASVGVAWVVRGVLPQPAGLAQRAGQLALLVVASTVALLLVDRLSRRALPLVTLLNLSLLFPDEAPSRLRVAREAIKARPTEEQLARVRDAGADPGAVAREILTLVAALSRHDRPTRGHAERVRMFTDLLAAELALPARDRDLLRWAALLHDIGKLRVPASLLNKPAKPTEQEWAVLRAHPAHGAEMAGALLPWLGDWGDVIVQHHERYDGTGYPTGCSGAQISLGARIVSVADAYDVMTAARAYKRPVSRAAALAELVRFSGSQFDPMVVRAMVAVGAPRLRRAQGLVAWLADVPLVATGSVPAATVARVVGAGALATGAVTGGLSAADLLDAPRARAEVVATYEDGGSAGTRTDLPAGPTTRPAGGRAAGHPGAVASPSAPASPVDPPGAGQDTAPPGAAATPGSPGAPAEPATELTAGNPTSAGQATPTQEQGGGSSQAPSPSTPTTGSTPAPGSGAGDTVTDSVSSTVTDLVHDPVGTVADVVDGTTGTVTDVVENPVGTVGDVVSDPVGTVGGLLGAGSTPSPSPSPSPTASGSGLLGGLLGR